MRKMLLVVAVLVGAALLLAQPQARAGNPCTVPKSWGTFRGVASGSSGLQQIVFEAEDGTIRITSSECGSPPKATVVLRSAD